MTSDNICFFKSQTDMFHIVQAIHGLVENFQPSHLVLWDQLS